MISRRDRYRGALLGLAAGDAVGTTVESKPPGTFPPVTDMAGGGPFSPPAGAWTDDTSMALCLADSLLACRTFDPVDQLGRYLRWFRDGERSSTGRCFDIGVATWRALVRFERTREPWRATPIRRRRERAADEARAGCALLRALNGHDPLSRGPFGQLHPEVEEVAAGSFLVRVPPMIRGTGSVVASLEAALWAVRSTPTFEACVLAAVNLGDDADTTAAVAGQLAGAMYGVDAIPRRGGRRSCSATRFSRSRAGSSSSPRRSASLSPEFCGKAVLFRDRDRQEHRRMPPPHVSYRTMGDLLEELDKRAEVLSPLMPFGQTLLFDWHYDRQGADGSPVGCFHNAFTRKKLFVSPDGRVFRRAEGGVLVEAEDSTAVVRAALPSVRDWLWVGGYAAGDLLGPPSREEDFAF